MSNTLLQNHRPDLTASCRWFCNRIFTKTLSLSLSYSLSLSLTQTHTGTAVSSQAETAHRRMSLLPWTRSLITGWARWYKDGTCQRRLPQFVSSSSEATAGKVFGSRRAHRRALCWKPPSRLEGSYTALNWSDARSASNVFRSTFWCRGANIGQVA